MMILSKEIPNGKHVVLIGVMHSGPFGLNYNLYKIIVEQDGERQVVGDDLQGKEAFQMFDRLGGGKCDNDN